MILFWIIVNIAAFRRISAGKKVMQKLNYFHGLIQISCLFITLFLLTGTLSSCDSNDRKIKQPATKEKQHPGQKHKIFYIGSYHEESPWSAGITVGITSVFNKRDNIDLKIMRMNTKRQPSEKSKKTAALKAKGIIETWQPELIIASDDNASKYLIVPYYRNSDLPFVFCGVNWDASVYGFPTQNITGMVEVSLVQELIKHIRPNAKGDKIGFLAPDTLSAHQVLAQNKKLLTITPDNIKFVQTAEEWKTAYLALQTSADMLLMAVWAGIPDWNEQDIINFIQEHIKIPSGSFYADIGKYTLMTCANDPMEQGEWAAGAALKIIDGKNPADIPIVTNKRAKIFLNMVLAKKMGFKFPMSLIEHAQFVE